MIENVSYNSWPHGAILPAHLLQLLNIFGYTFYSIPRCGKKEKYTGRQITDGKKKSGTIVEESRKSEEPISK